MEYTINCSDSIILIISFHDSHRVYFFRYQWTTTSFYFTDAIRCSESIVICLITMRFTIKETGKTGFYYSSNILTTSLIFSGNICNPCFEHVIVLGIWLRWHRHLAGQTLSHLAIDRIVNHVINDERNTSRCLIDRSSMFLSYHRGELGRIIACSPHSRDSIRRRYRDDIWELPIAHCQCQNVRYVRQKL